MELQDFEMNLKVKQPQQKERHPVDSESQTSISKYEESGVQTTAERAESASQTSEKHAADLTTSSADKDVFYYKNVNKELKSKLREVVAVNHRLAKTLKAQNGGESSGTPSFPVAVE